MKSAGRINPAGEAAYYGYRLPKPLNLDSPMTAEGRLFVTSGSGHCLLGFFNTNTINEWRTPNTLVARINSAAKRFIVIWSTAPVAGEPAQALSARSARGTDGPHEFRAAKHIRWKLIYGPRASAMRVAELQPMAATAQCEVPGTPAR